MHLNPDGCVILVAVASRWWRRILDCSPRCWRWLSRCNEFGRQAPQVLASPAQCRHRIASLDEINTAARHEDVRARLIILDTLNRMMAGGDQNCPQDMGLFIANVAELRVDTGAHVAVVHHGTKSPNGSTPRGHSSLIGAADLVVEITKGEAGSRTATVTAAKDDPDGAAMDFALRVVDLVTDKDGDMITTCVVKEQDHPAAAKSSPSATERKARVFLTNLIAKEGKPLPPGGTFHSA